MNAPAQGGMTRRGFITGSLAAGVCAVVPDIVRGEGMPRTDLPTIDYAREIILRNGTLIDVIRGGAIENAYLRMAQGKILAVGTGLCDDASAEVIDLGGAYVIPGLIDAHCHTTALPVFGMNLLQLRKLFKEGKRQFTLCIASGITTVRDMGAFPPLLHGFIHDIEQESLIGPRVAYCNSILNIKGSHPDIRPSDVGMFAELMKPFIGTIGLNFETMEDLKQALRENTKGASFIKLTVDNKSIFCRQGTIPAYNDEHLKEIFDCAEKNNLPVACHHHRKWGFDRITRYPIHSLEHMVCDAFISDDEALLMARKKIAVVPTLTIAQSFLIPEAYDSIPKQFQTDFLLQEVKVRQDYLEHEAQRHFDHELIRKTIDELKYYKILGWDHLWEHKKFLVNPDVYFGMMLHAPENLRKMKDAGVLIGCGIDAGMPFTFFGGQYREYELLSRVGFKNEEILKCATINNARILCMEEKIGSLEPGKYADLVVLGENPLKEIKALRNPHMVFKEGRILHCTMPVNLLPKRA